MFTVTKDPGSLLDYTFKWERWLVDNDVIAGSVWTVDAELTVETETHTDTKTTVWLSGGEIGGEYAAINHIVTTDGREEERTLLIRMEDR